MRRPARMEHPPAASSLTGPALMLLPADLKVLLRYSAALAQCVLDYKGGETMQLFRQIQRCYFFISIAAAANLAHKS